MSVAFSLLITSSRRQLAAHVYSRRLRIRQGLEMTEKRYDVLLNFSGRLALVCGDESRYVILISQRNESLVTGFVVDRREEEGRLNLAALRIFEKSANISCPFPRVADTVFPDLIELVGDSFCQSREV